jgi:hypothetical protein
MVSTGIALTGDCSFCITLQHRGACVQITFAEKGDEHPGREAADIVFQIDEKPHPTFKREGNDLVSLVAVSNSLCSSDAYRSKCVQRSLALPWTGSDVLTISLHASIQVYTHRLPLVDALSGTTVQLQHLDGSPISVPVDEVGAIPSLHGHNFVPFAAAAQASGRYCCDPDRWFQQLPNLFACMQLMSLSSAVAMHL